MTYDLFSRKFRRGILVDGADLAELTNHAEERASADGRVLILKGAVSHAALEVVFQDLDELRGAATVPDVGEVMPFKCAEKQEPDVVGFVEVPVEHLLAVPL